MTWRLHAHLRARATHEPLHISPGARIALSLLLGGPLIPPPLLPPPWGLQAQSAGQHPVHIL